MKQITVPKCLALILLGVFAIACAQFGGGMREESNLSSPGEVHIVAQSEASANPATVVSTQETRASLPYLLAGQLVIFSQSQEIASQFFWQLSQEQDNASTQPSLPGGAEGEQSPETPATPATQAPDQPQDTTGDQGLLEGPSFATAPSIPLEDASAPSETATEEYRAMWISYLEYNSRDLSTREKFVAEMGEMFAQCQALGLNRVIVQVRPFGDALYPSQVYPWSSFLTGTQGKDPGFDPLAEMITLAKSLDLQIEAWINPYRVSMGTNFPGTLSPDNPAQNSDLTIQVGDSVYYNPALPQVQALVVAGIRELVEGYDLDGIHLDDYFYPTTDLSIDVAEYLASGSSLSQADWRRENVNTLVRAIYQEIKAIDPGVSFGISPQGNNSNNYNGQYSDVLLWMSTPGYVDYIIPQIYWGFDYVTSGGSLDYQFQNCIDTWSQYPRLPQVSLYIGLGAYRIGAGDSSSATGEEWNSGSNLAKMILALRNEPEISGYVLFRYDSLFQNQSYPQLTEAERQAILALQG